MDITLKVDEIVDDYRRFILENASGSFEMEYSASFSAGGKVVIDKRVGQTRLLRFEQGEK